MKRKIALVTGAGRGIGFAAAKSLISEGRFVVMIDNKPIDHEKLGLSEDDALCFRGDVTDMAFMGRVREQTEALHGVITILVNNAGISPKRTDGKSSGILDLTLEEWTNVFNVNLTSMMRICQLLIPGMQEQGFGRIVSVSSLAGRSKSLVAGPSYMASKAGMLGLTRSIATEMGPNGITANCVAPGRILTDMARLAGEEVNLRYAEQIPVRRLGTPEEVGAAIAFLCADSSGFINGATIDINGGFFMS